MDFESGRRGHEPCSISWFEFLLNSNLLEEHLSQVNPVPSPTELIVQFLASAQNRDSTPTLVPVGNLNENKDASDLAFEYKSNPVETKKIKALKLLALKVAAFLNWNLDIFEEKLPLPVQNILLLEFLRVALDGEKGTDIGYHTGLDFCSLPDQALFAIQIYHRWVIRAVMLDNFPTKPSKAVNVPVPGQQNFAIVPTDNIMKMLHEMCRECQSVLERVRCVGRNITVPTIKCFEIPTETTDEVKHQWQLGVVTPEEEINCQVSYDLGCFYFFNEDYSNAGEMFFTVEELYKNFAKDSAFCTIKRPFLDGYLKACSSILKRKIADCNPSLEEQLRVAISNQYKGIFPLLMLDNDKRIISSAYRCSLEQKLQNDSMKQPKLKTAFVEVSACNIIALVLEGKPVTSSFLQTATKNEFNEVNVLLEAIQSAYSHANIEQSEFLKDFICYLCLSCGNNCVFSRLTSYDLSKYLSEEELKSLNPVKEQPSESKTEMLTKRDFSGNMTLQVGSLERDLLHSYEPLEVKRIIQQLYSLNVRKTLWKINAMWELPNPLNNFIPSITTGLMQDFIYIIVAKSRELTKLKNFNQSRLLLDVADREIHESSYLLAKLIRWETLLVDLLQFQTNYSTRIGFNFDLSKRCKACIFTLNQDKEVLPRPEIVEHCAAYLLSMQQWDILTSCDSGRNSRLDFASTLAKVCLEIRANTGSRKAIKELWELVLPIFSNNSSQQKRSASGMSSVLQREAPHAIFSRATLNQFMEKVQSILPLSVMISCLAKLHNILKDDSNNNIFLEYPAPWPAVVSNSGAFYIKSVCESLTGLLNCALRLYATYPPFLKTSADLNYVLGYHAKCLKYYLEAGVVSSDFFSQPVPRSVFDDQVYKRMIRCCSQLMYHTQAAVLCQFLEEVDYMAAFKALQEKNCSDAMDAYYNCFWDITILEFLVNLHAKRGEVDKKHLVLKVMGQTELNSSNSEEMKRDAANFRKNKFLRALTEQCLHG